MSAARHAGEADRAAQAFQLALTHIGVETTKDALRLWQELPPRATPVVAARWLSRAIRLILGRRGTARETAVAYYRLARALRTGRTVPSPYERRIPDVVTMAQLRREFRLAVEGHIGDYMLDQGSDGIEIPVDKDRSILEEKSSTRRAADREARVVIDALGPEGSKKRLDKAADDDGKVDPKREKDEHAKSGARQAAAAGRMAMNGGRGAIFDAIERDEAALGYARVPSVGCCAFCAMLASRGPVYKSRKSASRAIYGDGNKYHDNCQCEAVPIFSREQYRTSRLFDANRRYSQLWKKNNSSGGDIYTWRALIEGKK